MPWLFSKTRVTSPAVLIKAPLVRVMGDIVLSYIVYHRIHRLEPTANNKFHFSLAQKIRTNVPDGEIWFAHANFLNNAFTAQLTKILTAHPESTTTPTNNRWLLGRGTPLSMSSIGSTSTDISTRTSCSWNFDQVNDAGNRCIRILSRTLVLNKPFGILGKLEYR